MSRLLPTGLTLSVACAIGLITPIVTAAPAEVARCAGTSGVAVVNQEGVEQAGRGQVRDGQPDLRPRRAHQGRLHVLVRPGNLVPSADQRAAQPVQRRSTSAYWSYWHGARGGVNYSSAGAGGYVSPAPGTVEVAFGAGRASVSQALGQSNSG